MEPERAHDRTATLEQLVRDALDVFTRPSGESTVNVPKWVKQAREEVQGLDVVQRELVDVTDPRD